MKKLMILGGSYFQMPATRRAKEMGHYVISCDYLPNNPAHKYADEYHNVSTIDKEAVLKLAQKLNIDGIISYASDVSAETVAYVAEKLNLPGNPLSAIRTLTDKNDFRNFLQKNGFNCPKNKAFRIDEYAEFCNYINSRSLPVMVKPVDSSGSKGLTKLNSLESLKTAFDFAMEFSKSKIILVEDFIERIGNQLEMEGFVIDGKIVYNVAMDQHCDEACTKYSPIGSSVPTSQPKSIQEKAKELAQSVFDLIGYKFGSFNFEYILDKEENLYIMEIGPRNGGNFIPDMINYAQGIHLADYVIKSALNENCAELSNKETKRCVSYYLVHSNKTGLFKDIKISGEIKKRILEKHIYVNAGDPVEKFTDGRMGLGVFIIEFDHLEQKNKYMKDMNKYIQVIVE